MVRLISFSYLTRLAALFLLWWLPPASPSLELGRLRDALNSEKCPQRVPTLYDPSGLYDALRRAESFNAALDVSYQAIDHDFYPPKQVIEKIQDWLPMIAAVACKFNLPFGLLAGMMASELDLDYHLTDSLVDNVIRWTPADGLLSHLEIGAGYGGVHIGHLRRALANESGNTRFMVLYLKLITDHTDAELTTFATRDRLVDVANTAGLARYYLRLRLGDRQNITLEDMAFTWMAYRGGVNDQPADPPLANASYRWAIRNLQDADNVQVFGDAILSSAWFAYFSAVK